MASIQVVFGYLIFCCTHITQAWVIPEKPLKKQFKGEMFFSSVIVLIMEMAGV